MRKRNISKKILLICGLGFGIQAVMAQGNGTIARVDFDGSWYFLGVPSDTSKPLPIVVALHGDEGTPNNMKSYWETTWSTKKDFIFMAPECPRSLCENKTNGINSWSANDPNGSKVQGAWLLKAVQNVIAKNKGDAKRVYAVGYSGGAIFLGFQGFKMYQELFAGIQWFCGGVNQTEAEVYMAPANPKCKVPGRLVISRTGDKDYLITAAARIEEILKNNGHFNEYLDTKCRGHCCDAHLYSTDAYEWFLKRPPLCGGDVVGIQSANYQNKSPDILLNQVHGKVFLTVPASESGKTHTVLVFNLNGKIMTKFTYKAEDMSLSGDISSHLLGLEAGAYLLKLEGTSYKSFFLKGVSSFMNTH